MVRKYNRIATDSFLGKVGKEDERCFVVQWGY